MGFRPLTSAWAKLWREKTITTRSLEALDRDGPLDWLVSRDWLHTVKAEGDAIERTLNSIRELAPNLIGWVEQGASWTINESTGGRESERKIREEVDELLKRFRDLLGLEEGLNDV